MKRCGKCGSELPAGATGYTPCQVCTVRDGVGADFFECECGQTVPIHQSVRVMRKTSQRIERVCSKCATEGACQAGAHVIQTPLKEGWDPELWQFEPVPEDFPKGYCSACKQQMYFDGKRWGRMDWTVLAGAWEKARA